MAKKGDDSDKQAKKVTRITAAQPSAKSKKAKTAKTAKSKPAKKAAPAGAIEPIDGPKKGIFQRFIGYFRGAWYELRQVRWPNRRATWAFTAAVILFSLFFVVYILVLDAGFKYLFEQLLK